MINFHTRDDNERDSSDRFFRGVAQETNVNEAGEVISIGARRKELAHGACVGKRKNGRRWSHHPHVAFCHIHATALTFKCIYRVHDSSGRSKLVSSVSSGFVPRVRVRGTNLGPNQVAHDKLNALRNAYIRIHWQKRLYVHLHDYVYACI